MNKGDIVNCLACTFTAYRVDVSPDRFTTLHTPVGNDKLDKRCLYRELFETTNKVILLGKTALITGIRDAGSAGGYSIDGYDDYDPPSLYHDKHHPVWVVCDYSTDNRYYKPFYALEADLFPDTVSK